MTFIKCLSDLLNLSDHAKTSLLFS